MVHIIRTSMPASSMHTHTDLYAHAQHTHTRNTHCALLCTVVPVKCVRNARYIFARFTLSPKPRKHAEAYFSHFLCYNNPFYQVYMCIEHQEQQQHRHKVQSQCNTSHVHTHICEAIIWHGLAFNAVSKYQVNYDNSLLCEYVHLIWKEIEENIHFIVSREKLLQTFRIQAILRNELATWECVVDFSFNECYYASLDSINVKFFSAYSTRLLFGQSNNRNNVLEAMTHHR